MYSSHGCTPFTNVHCLQMYSPCECALFTYVQLLQMCYELVPSTTLTREKGKCMVHHSWDQLWTGPSRFLPSFPSMSVEPFLNQPFQKRVHSSHWIQFWYQLCFENVRPLHTESLSRIKSESQTSVSESKMIKRLISLVQLHARSLYILQPN